MQRIEVSQNLMGFLDRAPFLRNTMPLLESFGRRRPRQGGTHDGMAQAGQDTTTFPAPRRPGPRIDRSITRSIDSHASETLKPMPRWDRLIDRIDREPSKIRPRHHQAGIDHSHSHTPRFAHRIVLLPWLLPFHPPACALGLDAWWQPSEQRRPLAPEVSVSVCWLVVR